MASQPHYRIFTTHQKPPGTLVDFHLFPHLPLEIRLKIWRHSLQCQRVIELVIATPGEYTGHERNSSTDSVAHRQGYSALVRGCQVHSKLLGVSNESREAALKFYRIHLPCYRGPEANGQTTIFRSGLLYFNPEYDFLHIMPSPYSTARGNMIKFISHLKTTYDPQHIGLLNLALTWQGIISLINNTSRENKVNRSDIHPEIVKAFTQTLTQLHEVFFISHAIGEKPRHISHGDRYAISDTKFRPSYPIYSMIPTFERLRRDPRDISEDLKRVFIEERHLVQMPTHWEWLLRKWDATPTSVKYWLSVNRIFPWQLVSKFKNVLKRLERDEEECWTGAPDDNEGELSADFENIMEVSFGFWLFPLDSMARMPDAILSQAEHGKRKLLDVSSLWPQLAVINLI